MENKTLGQLLKGKTSGVFVNDKDEHYDAEEVNGVRNFYDLPIFKRHTY